VDIKMRKADSFLWAFRRVFGALWGLRPKEVHYLYVSIIQPSISFASLVWRPGCQTASAKKRLSRVHRLACLGIMGAMCTTPAGAMGAFTGPLHWIWRLRVRQGQRHIIFGVWDVSLTFTPVRHCI
jgi:hypothetical protein